MPFVGIGVGIGRQRFASGIFAAYAARVAADGGVTEAGACVDAVSGISLNSSLLLVPSGYKSGVVYSQIPTNGDGDLTFTRASDATRVNSDGEIEVVGSGVPRLDYSQGSCPALLLEPQRTNLALYSEQFDNAYWTKRGSTITSNATTAPDGQTTADELKDDTSSFLHDVYFTPTGYAENSYFTLSAFVKANTLSACRLILSQTLNANFAFASFNLSTQATSASIGGNFTNATSKIDSLANGWFRVSLTFKTGLGGTLSWSNDGCSIRLEKPYQTQIYTGTGQSLYLWGAQLEEGAYATSYIKTTSATVTRLADSFTRNNIYTNGLITSSGGTWFVELKGNLSYNSSSGAIQFGLGNNVSGASADNIWIAPAASGRTRIWKQVAGTLTSLFTTSTDTVKIAIKWNGTTADIFVNSSKVVSATSFTPTVLETLRVVQIDQPYFIQQMALYPTPLSDSDCISLTTL